MTRFEQALKVSEENTLGEIEKIMPMRIVIRQLLGYLVFITFFAARCLIDLFPAVETFRVASSQTQSLIGVWIIGVITFGVTILSLTTVYYFQARETLRTWEMALEIKRRGGVRVSESVAQSDVHSGNIT